MRMRKKAAIIVMFLFVLTAAGCGALRRSPKKRERTFFAMDTVMAVTLYGDDALLDQAQELVESLERDLSVTGRQSDIARLNAGETKTTNAGTASLIGQALTYCGLTDGSLDITVYPLVKAWGFTTGEYRIPGKEEIGELLKLVDYTKIHVSGGEVTVPENMQIDLGSVAKGYTGDQLIRLFRENGVTSALLNLGGNVQVLGEKPDGSAWKIAVRNPFGEGFVGTLAVRDGAVVTSGGYERFFEQEGKRYSHILDPKTGYPCETGLASVTVIGGEGILCDAYSTALYVMGYERAVEFWRKQGGFEAIFILDDGKIAYTEGMKGSFSLSDAFRKAECTMLERK